MSKQGSLVVQNLKLTFWEYVGHKRSHFSMFIKIIPWPYVVLSQNAFLLGILQR